MKAVAARCSAVSPTLGFSLSSPVVPGTAFFPHRLQQVPSDEQTECKEGMTLNQGRKAEATIVVVSSVDK